MYESKLVDWTATRVLAVLALYLEKYGKAKKSDILKIVGDHVTDKQLRNFLDQLKKSELIKTDGERGKMVYMLGEKLKKQNDIIAKALNIGLKALEGNYSAIKHT